MLMKSRYKSSAPHRAIFCEASLMSGAMANCRLMFWLSQAVSPTKSATPTRLMMRSNIALLRNMLTAKAMISPKSAMNKKLPKPARFFLVK